MFTKIRMYSARSKFVLGQTIYMCACNLQPNLFATAVNASMIELTDSPSSHRAELFDRAVMIFMHYNCINAETGRRTAFYIKEG